MFTNQNKITDHSYFMSLALRQAQKNLGNTKTNPSVGCVIVKNNGRKEPFDRDKIAKSINISLRKRPIDRESIEKFISKIVRNLEGLGENEIPTSTLGKFIMNGLANLDQVAYVRFASVYKNFKEAKDFEQFIGNLDVYKSE